MKIAPFKIEEWMNEHEASAKYDLTATCIKPLSIRELCSTIPSEIFDKQLDYGEITGSVRLKNAIKELYTTPEIKNITVTHGAIGANQLVFLSLLEKHDEVVSIVPAYQQHYSIPESLGAKVKLFNLKEQDRWLPNLDRLADTVTSKTKLICLTNPNNPTGAVIPDWMLEKIVEIAKERNVWVLSDEAYRGLNLYGKRYSKSVADLYERGISVGSMSKTYSLPGLRVGWVVAREDLINEINHQRQYNTISVSALDEYFAAYALENRYSIVDRNYDIMVNGLNTLKKWLKEESLVRCIMPTGGTTAVLKYKKNMSSRKLCYDLQEKTGVAMIPGDTFGLEGYLRIGYCADNLQAALKILSKYLRISN